MAGAWLRRDIVSALTIGSLVLAPSAQAAANPSADGDGGSATAMAEPEPAADPASVDLVLHLPLDEPSGTRAKDLSGRGNDGDLIRGAAFDPDAGARAGSVSLDGFEGLVRVADTTDINQRLVTTRTISAWFRAEDTSIKDRKQVIFEEGGSSKALSVYLHDGRLYVGGYNSSAETGWRGTFLSTERISPGRWHHVAMTLDGDVTPRPDRLRGYLDGELFASGAGAQVDEHGAIGIGRANSGARFHDGPSTARNGLRGHLDDVRVYNRVLSAVEVARLAEADVPVPPVNQAPSAVAGPDRTVVAGTTLHLDGTASTDPDGGPQPLTYRWHQTAGPTLTIQNADRAVATVTPATVGTYVFRLTVSDGDAHATDDVTITAVPTTTDAARVPGTDTSALVFATGEWDTNNQRRSWWNSHQQRWDAVLPVTGAPATGTSHWWVTGGVDEPQPRLLREFSTATAVRPDAVWDDEGRRLYVLGTRASKSFITVYEYDPAADTYRVVVDAVPVPGTDNASNRATLYRSPNGHLWTAMMSSKSPVGLWVNRSTDGGRTWSGPVRLVVPNVGGQTHLGHFEHEGRVYLAVAAAEDGKALNSRFRFLFIEQDSQAWADPTAWTDETSAMPSFVADEHADDEISLIVDRNHNVYIAAETEPGPNGSIGAPQLVLMVRSPDGSWAQQTITRYAKGVRARKRPTVAIDGAAATLHVFTADLSRTEISTFSAPLDDLARLASRPPTQVIEVSGHSVRNNVTPRYPTSSESGMLVLVDDLTDRTIWQRRLPTGSFG